MNKMLITNSTALSAFSKEQRIWQGIPGIAVTRNGRIFICFYSGGTREDIGNYTFVVKSDDNGENFSSPIVVAYLDNYRCFDPCLWIDPLGRLWFFWSVCPDHAVYATICEDPDAQVLKWGAVRKIGHDVMMNKPTVLTTGEWLLPIAVWKDGMHSLSRQYPSKAEQTGAFVYKSSDNGKSFTPLGYADIPQRSFDEHMILELQDGRLAMFIRTYYGIGVAYSYDRGRSWSEGADSGYGGPNSRFHICRLKSGRILLVNHYQFHKRNNLTALLSEDEGKTWCAHLLLDERDNVAYPDVMEAEDGFLYVVYDRERGAFKKTLKEALESPREILLAKITEEDILQGKLVTPGTFLKKIVSKLGAYAGSDVNPYKEAHLYTDDELAQVLLKEQCSREDIISRVFDIYPLKCWNQTKDADDKIAQFLQNDIHDATHLVEIIALIRTITDDTEPTHPTVAYVKEQIQQHLSENITVEDLAASIGMSKYYMCHLFKKHTGTTIVDFRNELRLTRAKEQLINTDRRITDIALDCGFFNTSYFSELFLIAEKVTPSTYRKLHKVKK